MLDAAGMFDMTAALLPGGVLAGCARGARKPGGETLANRILKYH
jgi:hypothetical protein